MGQRTINLIWISIYIKNTRMRYLITTSNDLWIMHQDVLGKQQHSPITSAPFFVLIGWDQYSLISKTIFQISISNGVNLTAAVPGYPPNPHLLTPGVTAHKIQDRCFWHNSNCTMYPPLYYTSHSTFMSIYISFSLFESIPSAAVDQKRSSLTLNVTSFSPCSLWL